MSRPRQFAEDAVARHRAMAPAADIYEPLIDLLGRARGQAKDNLIGQRLNIPPAHQNQESDYLRAMIVLITERIGQLDGGR